MPRRPPSSTLFPTRRSSDLSRAPLRRERVVQREQEDVRTQQRERDRPLQHADPVSLSLLRSEEHTSELQSPDHLVCRRLPEKTKNRLPTKAKINLSGEQKQD